MTALERLKLAAGPGGTTGDALKRIGRGAGLAGALLVASSGLGSATAAQHLLHVADQPQQVYGGGSRRFELDDDLRLLVEAKWEAIEQSRIRNRRIEAPDSADTGTVQPARTADVVPAGAVDLAQSRPDFAQFAKFTALPNPELTRADIDISQNSHSSQADNAALQRKHAQQRAALLALLIDELD